MQTSWLVWVSAERTSSGRMALRTAGRVAGMRALHAMTSYSPAGTWSTMSRIARPKYGANFAAVRLHHRF